MNQLFLKVTPTSEPTQYYRSALTGTVLTFGDARRLMELSGRSPGCAADLDEEFEAVHVHLLGPKLVVKDAVLMGDHRVYASTNATYGVDHLPTALAYLASEDF